MNLVRACGLPSLVRARAAVAASPLQSLLRPALPLAVLHQARRHFAQINGNQVRVGNVLEYKGKLVVVRRAQAVKPGKGGAFNQVELKDIRTGTCCRVAWCRGFEKGSECCVYGGLRGA